MSFTHVERAPVEPPRSFWPLLGLGMALAAEGATALILHTTAQWASDGLSILYLVAPVAALLVGLPAWVRFIVTPRCTTIRRGLLVGIVSGIIAHPVMWMLIYMLTLFMPQDAISSSFSFLLLVVLLSLICGGWATASIGALTGVLFIHLQRTMTHAQQ